MSASSRHPGEGMGEQTWTRKRACKALMSMRALGKPLTLAFGDRGYHIVNRPNPIPEGHKCEKQKGLY